jgi:hypothetical protein
MVLISHNAMLWHPPPARQHLDPSTTSNIARWLLRLDDGLSASSHRPCHNQTHADPKDTEDLSIAAQVYPDEGADQDPQRRDEERKRNLLLRTKLVVN